MTGTEHLKAIFERAAEYAVREAVTAYYGARYQRIVMPERFSRYTANGLLGVSLLIAMPPTWSSISTAVPVALGAMEMYRNAATRYWEKRKQPAEPG